MRERNKISISILVCLLIFMLFSCTKTNKKNSDVSIEKFKYNGLDREYIYYAPDRLEEDAPLVVVLHGFTSNAENIMSYSGFNELADENNFAVNTTSIPSVFIQ